MMDTPKRYRELGEFLKVRRGKIMPEQYGLPNGKRRRTPGLRREEVAQLAGIGLTWYTWLEQGREISVSDDVLNSLARVFLLTEQERHHLYALANKTPVFDQERYQPVGKSLNRVLQMLDLSCCPAYIMDHRWNIVAWNQSAIAVFGDFNELEIYQRNVLFMMFCNQAYMALFDDWEYHAKGIIARFHAAMAKYIDDEWFIGFVQDLKNKSAEFTAWWSLYEVNGMSDIVKDLTHPLLGQMTFEFVSFDCSDNKSLKLLIHNPDERTRMCLQAAIFK